MSPPTEQLIRDYLNRLSVAARGQLGPDERRALVNRTRDLIERQSGIGGAPTATEVASLLAGLGDPSRLVQQERQRLAAVRGELPEPAAGRNRIARALRRDSGRARRASWHWPVLEGSRADLQLTLLDGDEARTGTQMQTDTHDDTDGLASHSAGPPGSGATLNGAGRNGVARDQVTASADEPPSRVSAQASEPSWFLLALGSGEPDVPDQGGEPLGESADAGARFPDLGQSRLDDSEEAGGAPPWQLTVPRDPVVARQARRALSGFVAWYRRNPLEASAVVLLGLGGVIFPPVWLLGATVALASRIWDYRDKWIGLVLPLVLALIGFAIGAATGGHVSVGQDVTAGWVYGVVTSRIAAVLSACYLGWRSVHGRRPPAVPPWNRPHKIG
jgi:hypothetical protein